MRTPTQVQRILVAGVTATALSVVTAASAGAGTGPDPTPSGHQVEVSYAPAGTGISGQYVVRLREGASAVKKAGKYRWLHRYGDAVNGFAAELSAAELSALRRDADVTAIEQDRIYRADPGVSPASMVSRAGATPEARGLSRATGQVNPPSGLDRIDQRSLPRNRKYFYNSVGSGVNVYVIDTGIQISHPQFGGRAVIGYDTIGDGWRGRDCNGHGTHVAGTIGAKTYGVAKRVKLHSVRVLDCAGDGTLSGVIAGVNWVARYKGGKPVANMSLGGSRSIMLNDAVTRLSNSGVFIAVAAGNEGQDACDTSPASAAQVETTGAVSATDTRPTWSNYGSCVDIHAPGTTIMSTWPGGGVALLSGTSMASPHVAGVAALYKESRSATSFAHIENWLHVAASPRVRNLTSGTPNRLLYKSSL